VHISERGLQLIEGFEGFSSSPYWDPYGRVWTRGYGETEGITRSSPRISHAAAEARLRRLIETRYEWAIAGLGVQLNQNQWDALCSFAWNLGAGIFTGNLRAALTGHRWAQAARLMLAYDHAGGQVLPGLRHRREVEASLFLRPAEAYMPADEARWCREFDQLHNKHTPWAALRRRVLVRVMTRRRQTIWKLAQQESDGWARLNRGARYHALLIRTKG
jgi:GH24 family phage-related lysozyme (muramidase)